MRLAVVLCAVSLNLSGNSTTNAPPHDVAAPPAGAEVDGPGAFSVLLASGTSIDHPSRNDCVVIRFTAWRRNGSLFSTSGPNGAPGTQCISALTPALARILGRMSPGERRLAWLPPQTAPLHGYTDDDAAPPVSLTIDLELIQIRKAPPTPADLAVPPPDAQRLGSGVSMVILHKGSGLAHGSTSSKLTLNYSAWNGSGKLLESTVLADHPPVLPFALTPPAWREPLRMMVVGEKVRLWVPAHLIADKPPGDRIYDLELLSIE